MRIIITNFLCLAVFSIMLFTACGANSANNGPRIDESYEKSDTVEVDLKGFEDEQIIVYINGTIKIMFSYNAVMRDLNNHIEKYDVQYDKDLKKELTTMIKENDTLNAASIETNRMLYERLAFRFADILEKGEVLI